MIGPSKDDSLNYVLERISEYKLENYVEITGLLSKQKWIKRAKDLISL